MTENFKGHFRVRHFRILKKINFKKRCPKKVKSLRSLVISLRKSIEIVDFWVKVEEVLVEFSQKIFCGILPEKFS